MSLGGWEKTIQLTIRVSKKHYKGMGCELAFY